MKAPLEIGRLEARAMLDRAIAALKSSEGAALSKFNDQNDKQFHDRDLYVFCFNMSDGKVTSYFAPFLIGADVRTLTLINDPIGQRAYDTVRNIPEEKIVILQYKFPNLVRPSQLQSCLLRHTLVIKVAALPITNSDVSVSHRCSTADVACGKRRGSIQRSAINKPVVPIDIAAIATKSASHAKSTFRASRRSRNWPCSESQRNAN
jgi:hypothetical protein